MGAYPVVRIPETWAAGEGHGDYRDTLPTRTEDVAEQLAGIVQDGRWTFGLFECWGPRERLGTASHAPSRGTCTPCTHHLCCGQQCHC